MATRTEFGLGNNYVRYLALVLLKKLCNVIGCVVHAFIYAEPKLIKQNQSGFNQNCGIKRSH
jgi:hypothetical protein